MYVARFSENIERDIQRGWSGFMGQTFDSEEEAAEYGYSGDAIEFDEDLGKYRVYHHAGLSCWLLDAETLEDAISETKTRAELTDNDTNKIDWIGFGSSTIGTVKALASFTANGLPVHVLECESVTTES